MPDLTLTPASVGDLGGGQAVSERIFPAREYGGPQEAADRAEKEGGGFVDLSGLRWDISGVPIQARSKVGWQNGHLRALGINAFGAITMGPTDQFPTTKDLYHDITFRNMTLEGVNCHNAWLRNTKNLHLDRVEFIHGEQVIGPRIGCFVTYCERPKVRFCDFHDLNATAMHMNGCDHGIVALNTFTNVGDDAIDIDVDFLTDPTTVRCRWTQVLGNIIDGVTGGNGIRDEGSEYTKILGNIVKGAGANGISVNSAQGLGAIHWDVIHPVVAFNTLIGCSYGGIYISPEGGTTAKIYAAEIGPNNIYDCGNLVGGPSFKGGLIIGSGVIDPEIHVGRIRSCGNNAGGDGGGLLLVNQGNIVFRGGFITDCTNIGANLWSGGVHTYANVFFDGIAFRANAANWGGSHGQAGVTKRELVMT